jgi:signal transduction histidine kinase
MSAMSLVIVPEPSEQPEPDDRVSSALEPESSAGPFERNAGATQRITALGEMTAGIAHDFRNILAVIESGLRMAEDGEDDAAKRSACLAAAHEGVARGLRMTARLLAFANRQERAPGLQNVNDLLRELNLFLKYGAGPGIRIVLRLAPDLPACLIDPPQFNAAILNLVVNARDAMPRGGIIEVGTVTVVRAPPSDPGADHETFVRLRVQDNGRGMPLEVLRRVFDPYFTTKGEAGTGLGVPQVSAFVKAAGGFVSIDSRVGEGTSFDLFFPACDGRAPASAKLWRQLDRWVNEDGAAGDAAPPSMGAP